MFGCVRYDRCGVFSEGRSAEMKAHRAAGAIDPSLGRIFEGHCNGVLLVSLFGTRAQRESFEHDVADGHISGVWNTQDTDPVRIRKTAGGFALSGTKNWASGADVVSRPVITAAWDDGGVQMCVVPLDRVSVAVDASSWHPLGMHESNSHAVTFDGVELSDADIIGAPGDYAQQPWFGGGALRFTAVHAGIVERLLDETTAYVVARERDGDALQRARIANMRIGAQSALNWLAAGVAAWSAYDARPSTEAAASVTDTVDMARLAVERIALDAIEDAVRSVGAHGLVEPYPFAGLVRDLQMYLRQPAPDAALMRVAAAGIGSAKAARKVAVAASTG
jgi:alkylation response protein AidB-like acyl-CoA dehydrogenase